jgi:hypothetical protein
MDARHCRSRYIRRQDQGTGGKTDQQKSFHR